VHQVCFHYKEYNTIVPYCLQDFLETVLEALNDKNIYLKSDSGTPLVLWPKTAWDATDTLPLFEKWPQDATSKPRPFSYRLSVTVCMLSLFWLVGQCPFALLLFQGNVRASQVTASEARRARNVAKYANWTARPRFCCQTNIKLSYVAHWVRSVGNY
jgi:hypothetical protein